MLVLFLHAGDARYAVDARRVVEVVPRVALRRVPGAPPACAGLLEYRGQIVPVLDLGLLLGGSACADRMSTRIAVCDLDGAGALAAQGPSAGRRVGVVAERLTRLARIDPDAPGAAPGPRTPDTPALGRVITDAEGLVQLVEVGRLVPDALYEELTAGNGEAAR